MNGRDDRLQMGGHYDRVTGLVAKPTRADAHVAEYARPWDRPWFQPYMDFQPAPGLHTLEKRGLFIAISEWGELQVRGSRASAVSPDILGTLVLGANEDGEPTILIKER